jgi:hypothetical protein
MLIRRATEAIALPITDFGGPQSFHCQIQNPLMLLHFPLTDFRKEYHLPSAKIPGAGVSHNKLYCCLIRMPKCLSGDRIPSAFILEVATTDHDKCAETNLQPFFSFLSPKH